MASFQQYETKKGLRWLYNIEIGIDPATGYRKRKLARGFKTKKETQAAARIIEQELADDNFIANSNMTFKTVYEKWRELQKHQVKPSTYYASGCKFTKYILPSFGKLKIQDITKTYCQKFITELSETMINMRTTKTKKRKPVEAPVKRQFKSINEYKVYTSLVFQFAVEEGLIKKNPMANVKIPKIKEEFIVEQDNQTNDNFWDKSTVLKFYKVLDEHGILFDKIYFPLLVSTGMRKAEALALQWKDIDFKKKTIHVGKTLYFEKGEFTLLKPKSKKSDRIISIDDNTISLLKKWRMEQSGGEKIVLLKEQTTSFIFARADNTPIRLPYPNERLNILIDKGKLPDLTVHGLRHTHASLLFEAGASIKEVQERLGHSDASMTLNIYTHVSKAVKESTSEKFKNFMQI